MLRFELKEKDGDVIVRVLDDERSILQAIALGEEGPTAIDDTKSLLQRFFGSKILDE